MKYESYNYINRELSWIDFNKRVLFTGMEKDYKVLDKIKFFSIFSNNLDEFFMVRVASLKAQLDAGIRKKSIDEYLFFIGSRENINWLNKQIVLYNNIFL